MHQTKKNIRLLVVTLFVLLLLNLIGQRIFHRFDLTQDHRYTLSEAAKNTLLEVESPITVDVFLKGNLPPEFQRLQLETEQLLEEFALSNSNVQFQFINPLDPAEDQAALQQQMIDFNLRGAQVEVRENGKISTEMVYPWALAYYNGQTVAIPLLKNQLGATSEERVNNSIQNLEYAFADGFGKLTQPKRRKIAVLKGNGELEDRYLADFLTTLRDYYYIGKFTLDSVAINPQKTLEELQKYDLLIAAQPRVPFTEAEKYTLDQFTMKGGASLWLMDATAQQLDTTSGNAVAFGVDLNLNDFFFKYGVRINPDLVKDVYAAPISLASGDGNDTQYSKYPWLYSPLSSSANNHPIVTNLEAVKFDYASAIDTLPNSIHKTILLSTSPLSQVVGLPTEININQEIPKNLKIMQEGPNPNEFHSGEIPLAVLLEGTFTSVYNNRVKPFPFEGDRTESKPTRMIVISDGDVIKNQLDRGRPLELGFDKWTNAFYGNKEFLLNSVNYLLDDSGLINIRSKKIAIPFLDPQRTAQKRGTWQVIDLLLPLGLLGLFGFLYHYFRKRKYAR
ncbi:MAG TPA: gliding motility-associated ABC transporter substrate-binding protein GldG [Flavobacteriaceae bacterium]|nr:gliding motility-associated ABC transporter substrate-binding protein GldG [Flavobacteriaceae bacterium]MCB9213257.1 gliding motility-associated ABC transporter substrate-binding protein GldG [Alteromonas sp.]HPF12526.1 gliding motility-associated ABC transporter substrate-binding protein GldG [Flavobacteriaceae bacterium]HQU22437.1 gliding motility-associated ABC transporter substrate-binding protein GldG [Flavobacteriaceae bacterium]HQU66367.1 gliding motility-associated ABC transporter su